MSPATNSSSHTRHAAHRNPAPVFAALGDETRLWLVGRLAGGMPHSIAELTEGSQRTRQAITKHLQVLQDAGIVRSVRAGRESRFEYEPQAIEQVQDYLTQVSRHWDQALVRLKSFVED
jgi:DNA-binding transcriptional ArsR family regulator